VITDELHDLAVLIADHGKHTDEENHVLAQEAGERLDMRAVVIVEFWAMMAGALPLGWRFEERDTGPYTYMAWASGPGGDIGHPERVQCQYSEAEAVADLSGKAWAAEYAARPRLER